MKKLVLICLVVINVNVIKAQFVNIPDTNFRNWLNTHGFASCMNGNMMDTTCSAVVNATIVSCDNSNIYNLEGIQYFDHLLTLGCGVNNLTSLPFNLPNTLEGIMCDLNQITQIGNLPPSLIHINCDYNQISSLPVLPASLQTLSCIDNQIAFLPSLPPSLFLLYCSKNQLTSLPSLPNGLEKLYCDYNLLSSLPALPSSLTQLGCAFNQLTSVPSLPSSLILFSCRANQLTFLPSLPASISWVCDFAENQLTYIPDLPDSVDQVYLNDNPLNCFPKYNRINQLNWTNTTITCLPNIGSIGSATPAINNLPLCFSITVSGSTTVCNGGGVTLNAFTGNNSTYQWKKNGTNISGATASSYIASTGGSYSVQVASTCGPDTSSPVIVTVNSLPSATITPGGTATFCSGNNVLLSVPSGANKTYQWKKGANIIPGATLSSYTANTGGNYRVIVTNTVTGCSKTTTSPTIVTVNPSPPATITPQGPTTFCSGGSVLLNGNYGAGFIYQWKKGGNDITGATAKNYTASIAGTYKIKVTNSYGCAKLSTGVTVIVPCRENESVKTGEGERVFDVKVFPNPNSGEFSIKFSNKLTSPVKLELTNEIGKVVKKFETDDETVSINESNLANGIYCLTARNDNKVAIKKINIVK